jgi:MSHA biogenesis protein MshL
VSRPIRGRALTTGAVLFLSACASAGIPAPAPYQVATRTEAPPPLPPPSVGSVIPRPEAGPPPLAAAQPAIVGMPSKRVNLSVKDGDVAEAIGEVARQVGLTAIIDPSVRGAVTRTLHNASLNDAMMNLVGSQFQYQVRNGALVVTPIQLVQHTYTVDYLQMSRISTASTVVSRGSSGGSTNQSIVAGAQGTGTGVSSTAGGLVASGSDVIQSSSNVDVWGELTQQLESILFSSGADSAKVSQLSAGGSRGTAKCALNGTCLRISPLTSLVDVTATPEKQEEVARYIGLYSAAITRQVSIKAQVVEVGLDRSNSFGIDWMSVLNTAKAAVAASTNPLAVFPTDVTQGITTGSAAFNLGLGDFSLRAVLTALQSVGDVSVVATPSTNAMNQQKASFNVTRQRQFFTVTTTPVLGPTGVPTGATTQTTSIQTATVGLVFDVLPQISHDNIVTMAIRPSVTSLVESTPVVVGGVIQGSLPVIDSRETDTMARVRSGETIMIGGLIQKQTTNSRSGIPLLMNLPGIGRFFSQTKVSEKTSELVIFLTPEIVSGQPPRR